jgi:hypothetical protein
MTATLHDLEYFNRASGGTDLRDLSHSERLCAAMRVLQRLCPNMPASEAWDQAERLVEEFADAND